MLALLAHGYLCCLAGGGAYHFTFYTFLIVQVFMSCQYTVWLCILPALCGCGWMSSSSVHVYTAIYTIL